MKYQNKRNGEIVTVVETNEKFKTVIVELADGSTKTITSATLRRWYVLVEESEDKAADGTPMTEVMQQIVAGAEEKAKKACRNKVSAKKPTETSQEPHTAAESAQDNEMNSEVKKPVKKASTQSKKTEKKSKKADVPAPDMTPVIDWICNKVLALGGEVFAPEKASGVRAFKIDGHMFARINISKKAVTLCCRSKVVSDILVPEKTQQHMFDAMYKITDLTRIETLGQLLEVSMQYQVDKKSKKEVK